MWQAIHSLFVQAAGLVRNGKPDSSRLPVRAQNGSAPSNRLTILAVVSGEKDRCLLRELGDGNQWSVSFADTWEEAQGILDRMPAAVVLCDRDLPGREWWECVEVLATRPHRPCVLLVSRVADDYLWNEVVRRGGYDVLSKPLRPADVLRAVKLAWSYWNAL